MGSIQSEADVKQTKTASIYHPLGPLTGEEFTQCAAILQALWPEDTTLRFKSMLLLEPPKGDLLPYLDAKRSGQTPTPLNRVVYVAYYIQNTVSCSPIYRDCRSG